MTKSWYTSKSLQGSVIATAGLIVQVLKLPVASEELSAGVSAILLLIGIAYSIYGRVKTKGEKLTK